MSKMRDRQEAAARYVERAARGELEGHEADALERRIMLFAQYGLWIGGARILYLGLTDPDARALFLIGSVAIAMGFCVRRCRMTADRGSGND